MTTSDFDMTDKIERTLDPQNSSSRSSGGETESDSEITVKSIPQDSNLDASLIVNGNSSQELDTFLRDAETTPIVTLSPETSQICVTLMSRIVEYFTPILFTVATTSHMECTDVLAETWMPLVIQPAIRDSEMYKPLESLERIKSIDWVKHGLCASCTGEKREEWTNEQKTFWKLIDTWLKAVDDAVDFAEDTDGKCK